MEVVYFRTNLPHSLAGAILGLIRSPVLRSNLAKRNLQAARKYSPAKICQAYLHAFNLALGSSNHPSRLPVRNMSRPDLP